MFVKTCVSTMVKAIVGLVVISLFHCILTNGKHDGSDLLSRKKRWLIFPKGSSLQLVYCFLISTFGTRDGIFTVGITVGLAWEIPVDVRDYVMKHGEEEGRDRDRRNLMGKIEKFLNRKGEDGRNCILRAICEAKNYNKHTELKFVERVFHEIFNFENVDAFWNESGYLSQLSWDVADCSLYPCNVPFFQKNT